MAVPEYQTFMLPILQILADGASHRRPDIRERAADLLILGPEDRTALLPSGKGTALRSRVGWALTYLKQAGLVEIASRGVYRITQRGKGVLGKGLPRIDGTVLQQFEEFRAFRARSGDQAAPASEDQETKNPSMNAQLRLGRSVWISARSNVG
jgi:restriction system protein